MARVLFLVLAACGGVAPDDTGAEPLAACELAESYGECPACSDGPRTCSFGDVSATEESCGDCQALGALYEALCAEGETATEQEILDGATCVAAR